ncbi:hypothetical protein Hanom_Chr05g00408421 [Helianthus anomalus]
MSNSMSSSLTGFSSALSAVTEHMLISQFCFRIHNSGIETWKTDFYNFKTVTAGFES